MEFLKSSINLKKNGRKKWQWTGQIGNKYTKHTLIELKEGIDKSSVVAVYFNTPLLRSVARPSRQKIIKDMGRVEQYYLPTWLNWLFLNTIPNKSRIDIVFTCTLNIHHKTYSGP